jgi:hypothetical protein
MAGAVDDKYLDGELLLPTAFYVGTQQTGDWLDAFAHHQKGQLQCMKTQRMSSNKDA